MNQDDLFPMPTPESSPLSAEQLARLREAGATENEVLACASEPCENARALLVACFCDALPGNWHKLACMVRLLLWRRDTGLVKPIGGDVLTNTVKGVFRDCEGNNNHRLIFTRLVFIVRPDLRAWLDFNDGGTSEANAVLVSGWKAPATVDWYAIKPANLGNAQP